MAAENRAPARAPRIPYAPRVTKLAERNPARAGNVTVYAAAAGLASAVPIPLVDGLVAQAARGGAMRRIAMRHGVTLTSEARRVLGKAGMDRDPKVKGYKLVRSIVQRFWLPLVAMDRVEDGLASLASSLLFQRYLVLRDIPRGAVIDEPEAYRIRQAIDIALVGGLTDAMRSVPENLRELGAAMLQAARSLDDEGRGRHEAVLDTLLDAVADVPEGVLETLVDRFERALADGADR
jgi:hypothetical protein